MTDVIAKALRRLIAEATADNDARLVQGFYLYGTKAQVRLGEAASKSAPALLDELDRLRVDNERLRAWIREEGLRSDTCTYGALGEICNGCRCAKGRAALEGK